MAFTFPRYRKFLRRLPHVVLASMVAFCLCLEFPLSLWAHPLGNFTVNRYSRLEIGAQQVHLVYIIDMAEIPTHQERAQMDKNGDQQISQVEQDQYLAAQVAALQRNAHLTIDGAPVAWTVETSHLAFHDGQANLPIMRLEARYAAPLHSAAAARQAAYQDDNFPDRIGWREVVVRAESGVALLNSTAPDKDQSNELRNYPSDLLQQPADIYQANFTFQLQADAGQKVSTSAAASKAMVAGENSSLALRQAAGPFADRIAIPTLGPLAILLALLAAFGYGAAHALTPGHGKTIVGAYLVGSRGTLRHAIFLGLTTTITHTAGIFALGLVMWFASSYILPEKIFPWMSLLSGVLVVLIGISLVWGGLRNFLGGPHPEHAHPHSHDHAPEHVHAPGFVHSHGPGHTHSHLLPGADGERLSWRSLLVLGVSGGLVPCPDALVGMLGAIALQRVGFGLIMLIAYSLGLASVLTLIGVLLVHSGQLFERIPESGHLLRFMPVASALFITLVGLGISWQALVQTGMFTAG
ncbi:MAG: hypothetical protein U0350_14215 [Caldilineaceae bacterium]